MKSIEIKNVKKFTEALFIGKTFDDFLCKGALFDTICNFEIDGHINYEFLSDEEKANAEIDAGCVKWKDLKPLCYQIIKGKKLPVRFKVVLMTSPASAANFVKAKVPGFDARLCGTLSLNVSYNSGALSCVTGTALKEFSMDRSLENAWDEYAEEFLEKMQ